MAWNPEDARASAQVRYDETEDLEVSEVKREIDFELIERKKPRQVTGTHFYVDVTNFNQLLRGEQDDAGEEMLRLLHLFAREVTRVVEKDFGAQKVHFQGPRLHAVAYRPVSDEGKMALQAVLASLAVRHMISAFNDVFDLGERGWRIAAGLDHGRCLATKNGSGGDRELLFLGSAANHAAKILQASGIRMTDRVRSLLPEDLQARAVEADDGTWFLRLSVAEVEELAAAEGWPWCQATTRGRLEEAAASCPAGSLTSAHVKEKIDKNTLRPSNTKLVSAASLFADVDGFTAYIDQQEARGEDLTEAVRVFHVLRGVGRDTAVQGFSALRIQYQGDRMQVLAYRPVSDEERAAYDTIRLAAALTTVADDIVPRVVGTERHRLAIGACWGETLVSRVGEHGEMDYVCLSSATASAATIQQRLDGGQIGIDGALRNLLPTWLRAVFRWDANAGAYVATDFDWASFCTLEESEKRAATKSAVRPWLSR
ncbi:hypothetical protein AB0L41_06405 [Amycolatopsis mediterranei]|uniref:hypothetical protein n=1 Tax=Amycolatopsis mediterranei TaxID=33910 RepID=UPI00344AE21C